ncbi:MAG: aminoacyl-tRNA hydrolase [Patescibacteria group bacterium]
MDKLIIGLGNPEEKYAKTKHNIGKEFLDFLSNNSLNQQGNWKKISKLPAEIKTKNKLGLVKLSAYMNQSGPAIKQLLNYYKLLPERILVIHDDTDLIFGKVKFTHQSLAAGHHGIESIIRAIGSNQFARIRIGVRPENSEQKAEALVLRKITKKEEQIIEQVSFPKALDLTNQWLES